VLGPNLQVEQRIAKRMQSRRDAEHVGLRSKGRRHYEVVVVKRCQNSGVDGWQSSGWLTDLKTKKTALQHIK
jgi:hypothetical protein